mgnify:CR=1 FL=1
MGEEVGVREKVGVEAPDLSLMIVLTKLVDLSMQLEWRDVVLRLWMEEDSEEIEKELFYG